MTPNASSQTRHRVLGKAYARAGLLGNPSDGYGGKTISLIVRNFAAEVSLQPSRELEVVSRSEPVRTAADLRQLQVALKEHGYYGAGRLVLAACKRFADYCGTQFDLGDHMFRFEVNSTIPRLVGLAGSSAIVVATLRALIDWYRLEIPPHLLASLALNAERDELSIPAGLQDRVAQSMEGLVYMDFSSTATQSERGLHFGSYERLPIENLPPLYLAYSRRGSEPTEVVHANLRQRFLAGDPEVLRAIEVWAGLAEQGKQAILARNKDQLSRLIDANFDLRREVCPLNPHHLEMVETARSTGCSAKYSGSGGAIIGTYSSEQQFMQLVQAMSRLDCQVLKPIVE